MRHLLLGLLTMFLTTTSYAELISSQLSDKKIADIGIAKSAEVSHGDNKAAVTLVGAGLRSKKVVFVNVKVYVGQFFVAHPESFNKSQALDSASSQSALAMQMTFLRDVESEKVMTSFEDSFKANGIDLKDETVAKILSAVRSGGDVKTGKKISLAAFKKEKTDLVLIETPNGQITEISGEGLTRKVLSLWLGKTTDSGVEDMKKEILK